MLPLVFVQLILWLRMEYFVESACEYPFQPLKDPAHPKNLLYCNLEDSLDICPLQSTCEDLWLGLYVCCGYNMTLHNDTIFRSNFSETQKLHRLENPNLANRKNARLFLPDEKKQSNKNGTGTMLMYFTTQGTSNMYSTPIPTINETEEILQMFMEDANASSHTRSSGTIPVTGIQTDRKSTKRNNNREGVLKSSLQERKAGNGLVKESPKDLSINLSQPENDSNYFDPNLKSGPQIFILQEGLSKKVNSTSYKFPATITLIVDHGKTIVVDTGLPTDYELLGLFLTELSRYGVEADTVDVVVTTHGHPDHFGHLNLFSTAVQIFGGLIYVGNTFSVSDLYSNEIVKLTDNVSVYKTPGHTAEDLSVLVKNVTKLGTVAVVGDLFFSRDDLIYPEIWESQSWNSTLQNQYRRLIICISDYIIPGHGSMFHVENDMRKVFDC